MFADILTASTSGIEGIVINVETDVAKASLPSFCIVGLGDAAVRESRERIASALRNTGFMFPLERVTVNLAPADIKKEGTGFDLPIAVCLLLSSHQLYAKIKTDKLVMMGELSLSGEVKEIRGVLPMVASLQEAGYTDFILPYGNAAEAALAGDGACIYPARDLNEVCAHLRGEKAIKRYISSNVSNLSELTKTVDMSEVKGHEQVKRAMEIAAAGGHNMLMIGPPGSGKSMLAKRFATILPEMTLAEKLEATKIYSVAGKLKSDNPLISARPFRFPHHTASPAALIGGGINVRPGEVSFAHGGVLYLDEFAEFPKQSLDMLRQPIEDGCVTVARLSAALTYPSSFILLASMNPCPCGYYNDERHDCKCTQAMIEKYRSKISGPILDRIDIVTQVNVESYDNLSLGVESQESSAQIRQRVIGAREFALERTGGGFSGFNSRMSVSQLEKYCSLDPAEDSLLRKAFEIYAMSARSCHRVLKLARTIADLDFSEKIKCVHLTEALQYRGSDL